MSSPRNTNNTQNNSQTREYRKSGNPLGVLFGLLLLGGVCFGLYYLWKVKKNGGNISLPFNQASSLNLNSNPNPTTPSQPNQVQLNNNTTPTTQPTNSTDTNSSQFRPNQQPYSYSNTNPDYNNPPGQRQNRQINRIKPQKQNTQKLIYQSKDGRKRVLTGYGGGNSNHSSQSSNQSSSYIFPSKVLPARGFIPGSLQSLISDDKSFGGGLPRPHQLIYFATNFYQKEKALAFATNKLKALGFYRTHLSSDEYSQGGQTIVEGLDKNNNQAFFFFKPNNNKTMWKVEIYEAN